jgi:hypothetical protein
LGWSAKAKLSLDAGLLTANWLILCSVILQLESIGALEMPTIWVGNMAHCLTETGTAAEDACA